MDQMVLMEQITRKMAEAFQNIHNLCLQKLKHLEDEQHAPSSYQKRQEPLQNQNSSAKGSNSQEKSKEKKQRKSNPNRPKMPMSALSRFCQEQKQIILKDLPNQSHSAINKIATTCWKQLSDAEKQPYLKKYQIQKDNYNLEMEKYLRENPEEVKNKKEKKKQKKIQKQQPSNVKLQQKNQKQQDKHNSAKEDSIQRFFKQNDDDSLYHI